jgi:PAS domain S-box-containing protein
MSPLLLYRTMRIDRHFIRVKAGTALPALRCSLGLLWARAIRPTACSAALLAMVVGVVCLFRPTSPIGLFLTGIAVLGLTAVALAWVGTFLATRAQPRKTQLRREVRKERAARLRAEKTLLETESQFRSILDTATDVITYVSRSGRMRDVNARVEQVFGYKPEEIIGRHFIRLGILRLQDIPKIVRLFRMTLRRKKADQFVELELKHKNGNSVFVEAGTQFIVEKGKVKGVVNVFRDITERRRVLDELTTAKKAAEVANRAKSEFLANMSHEIRTPMTAILGFAEVLSSSISDAEGLDAVKTIQRNGEYLLAILNDILDLSKIEAGKLQIERLPCSPFQIVDEVISLMHIRADAKNVTLTAEYAGALPELVLLDPTRLRQILINLIGNAIKFTDTGGVRLVTSAVQNERGQSELRFDVIDTGMGMSEGQTLGLFRPFTQGYRLPGNGTSGTGLGLAISKRLAETLGGTLSVQSAPGAGSTFTATIGIGLLDGVRMCAHTAEAAVAGTEPAALTPQFQGRLNCRVLLAEDGLDNQRLLSLVLRKSGAEIEVVENGRLAVEAAMNAAIGSRPFDIVLMDMQMPVMDGYQATERLRSLGYRGPIVALTAHAMNDDRHKCLEAGCDDYLTKPIDRRRLLATVAQQISGVGETLQQESKGG